MGWVEQVQGACLLIYVLVYVHVPVQQPWMSWVTLKGGLEMKRTGCERRMKPRQSSDQGSKFNSAAPAYKGKTTKPILHFCWITLQGKVSRQSILLSSCRKLQVQQGDDSSWVVKSIVASTQGLLSLLKAGEEHCCVRPADHRPGF